MESPARASVAADLFAAGLDPDRLDPQLVETLSALRAGYLSALREVPSSQPTAPPMSVSQAADAYRLPRDWFYDRIREGSLKPIPGGRMRLRPADIEGLLSQS